MRRSDAVLFGFKSWRIETTSCPSSRSFFAICAPMKPEAPVTKAFILVSYHCEIWNMLTFIHHLKSSLRPTENQKRLQVSITNWKAWSAGYFLVPAKRSCQVMKKHFLEPKELSILLSVMVQDMQHDKS